VTRRLWCFVSPSSVFRPVQPFLRFGLPAVPFSESVFGVVEVGAPVRVVVATSQLVEEVAGGGPVEGHWSEIEIVHVGGSIGAGTSLSDILFFLCWLATRLSAAPTLFSRQFLRFERF
jgi:hypothetical protein